MSETMPVENNVFATLKNRLSQNVGKEHPESRHDQKISLLEENSAGHAHEEDVAKSQDDTNKFNGQASSR